METFIVFLFLFFKIKKFFFFILLMSVYIYYDTLMLRGQVLYFHLYMNSEDSTQTVSLFKQVSVPTESSCLPFAFCHVVQAGFELAV